MSGFGAFREPEDIDFSDVDYVALVGPTGSGKSTIIDAMCFALYGCIPRYSDQRRVGYIVTTGASDARVSFTFDSGGRRYVATRVVQRKPDGKALTREARLEVVDGDSTATMAGSVSELDDAIEHRVLGMPFEHFTRCVVLPQGEFARFLSDPPRKRQDMLVNLLGLEVYGRMGKRANELRAFHEGQSTQLRAQAEALAHATPEAAEAKAARLAELGRLRETLAEARGSVEKLDRQAEEAQAEAARAGQQATALAAVQVPAGVAEAGRGLAAARLAYGAAQERRSAAAEAVTAAEEARRSLGERGPVDVALADRARLTALATEVQAARDRLASATATAEDAVRAARVADSALRRAEDGLLSARAARAAHSLAERLEPGEPCPVCLAVVEALPQHSEAPDLGHAKRMAESARTAAEASGRAAAVAEGRRAAASEHFEQREAEEGALRQRLAEAPSEAELQARIAAIHAAESALAEAREAERGARAGEAKAAEAEQQAARTIDALRSSFDTTRDTIAALGAPLPARLDLAADWQSLAGWAAVEAPIRRALEGEASQEAARLRQAARHRLASCVAACSEAGLDAAGPATVDGLERACIATEAATRGELGRIREAMEQAEGLATQAAAASEHAVVAKELARHLSAKGFERWVLAETVEALVAGASVILRELSSDAYSLATDADGEFWVIDHRNADERRSAKTLSGGETFQASLALALSLAEQLSSLAAAGAARVEATFIDEGFGTLDEDTLDTVAATLENLAAGDRLVGVVTHTRLLAERVPVRLEVAKGPRTSTVTKVVAG
jgi:exonuclease SbcC